MAKDNPSSFADDRQDDVQRDETLGDQEDNTIME